MRQIRIKVGWLLLAGLLLFSGCGLAVGEKTAEETVSYEIRDASGVAVQFVHKPQRILTATTGTDEIVLGLVRPEKLVAVNENFGDSRHSNIAALTDKISVKIPRNPPVETVASLRPDVVFVQSWIPQENIAAMRDMGIPVVVCRTPQNLEDVRYDIRLIAAALGEKNRGERLVRLMDEKLKELTERIAKVPAEQKGKRIALISIMPSYGGKGCTFDDICRYTGSVNAKAAVGIHMGQSMTKEQLVDCNPDYLFLPTYNDASSHEDRHSQDYLNDPSLATLAAVRENHICHPRARYIYNVSQNIVFGIQEAAWLLYGDDFQQPQDCHLSVAGD